MLYRNFLAMETEELLRSHPVDGAVLMGGCDKTTPGLTDGRAQHGPALRLPARRPDAARQLATARCWARAPTPSSTGTNAAPATSERRQWLEMEGGIARSHGTCMTMGTAATMMGIAEALGLALPGASSIPAADANHMRMSPACGRRIVDMVWEDLTPGAAAERAPTSTTASPAPWPWAAAPTPSSTWWPCRAAPATAGDAGRLRRRQPPRAGHRQHPAQRRQVPDGGLLLRRRPAGAAAAHPRHLHSTR
jgi:hypothetical protein